jgi:hypothetical protein
MSENFDPYYVWLGIPPTDQPPDHYRLLGITRYEPDENVISHAADQRMLHLRTFQSGKNGQLSQSILNEISQARLALLDAEKKRAYDQWLRSTEPLQAMVVPAELTINKGLQRPFAPSSKPTTQQPWLLPVVLGVGAIGCLVAVIVVGIVIWSTAGGNQPEPIAKKQAGETVTDSLLSGPNGEMLFQDGRIDLLARGEADAFLLSGHVQWESGELNIGLPDKKNTRYLFHGKLPNRYEVQIQATRFDNLSGLAIGLPIGEGRAYLVIDRNYEELRGTGLELVDGLRCLHPQYLGAYQSEVMSLERKLDLRIQVEPNRVVLAVDNLPIYEWRGTSDQLSVESWRTVPEQFSHCLTLQSWDARFTIHKLEIATDFSPLGPPNS